MLMLRIRGFFKAMLLVWYSADFYRALALRWRGVGILFLALAVAVLLLLPGLVVVEQAQRLFSPSSVPYTTAVESTPAIPQWLDGVINQLPPLTLEKAVLNAGSQAVQVETPLFTRPLMVVDTNKPVEALLPEQTILIVTAHALHITTEEGIIQTLQWRDLLGRLGIDASKPLEITHEMLRQGVAVFLRELPVTLLMVYGSAWASLLVMMLSKGLMFGLVAMVFCRMLGVALPTVAVIRIGCVSGIPVLCLMALNLAGIQIFGLPNLVYLLLQAFIVFRMVEAISVMGKA